MTKSLRALRFFRSSSVILAAGVERSRNATLASAWRSADRIAQPALIDFEQLDLDHQFRASLIDGGINFAAAAMRPGVS